MAAINWGYPSGYDNGFRPSVAMNDSGVIVEVHETRDGGSSLWYHIGAQSTGNKIDWGSSYQYGLGEHPSVAINNSGYVVQVHKALGYSTLWYRIGKVDADKKAITWWGPSFKYGDGIMPAVAINDKGLVVEVHEGDCWISKGLYYITGTINTDKNTIQFTLNGSKSYADKGTCPALALNNQGQVVEVHSIQNELYHQSGTVKGDAIGFNSLSSASLGDGYFPTVALNDKGMIIVAHESLTCKTLRFRQGTLDSTGGISLGSSQAYDNGKYPSVAAAFNQDISLFVEVHKSNESDSLWYHSTRQFPSGVYKLWMTQNSAVLLPKQVSQIMLPGTHASGVYQLEDTIYSTGEIVQWLDAYFDLPTAIRDDFVKNWSLAQTQSVLDQLNGGIRYLDLYVTFQQNDYFIHQNGILGPKLLTVFKDIILFISKSPLEMVIVSASHMEGMNDASHAGFIALITANLGPFLFQNVPGTSLPTTPLSLILQKGPKIIFIYDNSFIVSHPNPMLWPGESISKISGTSNTDIMGTLAVDQEDKLKQFTKAPAGLFELFWTLTPQKSDMLAALLDDLNLATSYIPSLHTLSQAPNQSLGVSKGVNVVMTDFYEESDLVQQCVKKNITPL